MSQAAITAPPIQGVSPAVQPTQADLQRVAIGQRIVRELFSPQGASPTAARRRLALSLLDDLLRSPQLLESLGQGWLNAVLGYFRPLAGAVPSMHVVDDAIRAYSTLVGSPYLTQAQKEQVAAALQPFLAVAQQPLAGFRRNVAVTTARMGVPWDTLGITWNPQAGRWEYTPERAQLMANLGVAQPEASGVVPGATGLPPVPAAPGAPSGQRTSPIDRALSALGSIASEAWRRITMSTPEDQRARARYQLIQQTLQEQGLPNDPGLILQVLSNPDVAAAIRRRVQETSPGESPEDAYNRLLQQAMLAARGGL